MTKKQRGKLTVLDKCACEYHDHEESNVATDIHYGILSYLIISSGKLQFHPRRFFIDSFTCRQLIKKKKDNRGPRFK